MRVIGKFLLFSVPRFNGGTDAIVLRSPRKRSLDKTYRVLVYGVLRNFNFDIVLKSIGLSGEHSIFLVSWVATKLWLLQSSHDWTSKSLYIGLNSKLTGSNLAI